MFNPFLTVRRFSADQGAEELRGGWQRRGLPIIKVNLLAHMRKYALYKIKTVLYADNHHMTEGPHGILYCCENDNPKRSSYLWKSIYDSTKQTLNIDKRI